MAEMWPILVLAAAFLCSFMALEVGSSLNVDFENNNKTFLPFGSEAVRHFTSSEDKGFKGRSGLEARKNSTAFCRKRLTGTCSSLSCGSGARRRHSKKSRVTYLGEEIVDFVEKSTSSNGSEELDVSAAIIRGNSTILSENRTFQLGYFSVNGGSSWYLGIWYTSVSIRTYVWVANREVPVKNLTSATVTLTRDGRLKITDSGNLDVWQTANTERATVLRFLDTGNLVLLSREGKIVWQSFDFPADTFLPGMNVTSRLSITCWRSPSDPSPGNYSLRLKPPEYGEFELVFNGSETYWSSGKWTGIAFSGVPEMMVRYIYLFRFLNPFTPEAAFVYTVVGLPPLPTRFSMDHAGQLMQYTWAAQTQSWNMFWFQPENHCRVYGLCGNLGLCTSETWPCQCHAGFQPVDDLSWNVGDFSGGCRREGDNKCDENDSFEEVGDVSFDEAVSVSFSGSLGLCKESCLNNCSCLGVTHNTKRGLCRNLYGNLLNLRNLTSDTSEADILYLRVGPERLQKGKNKRTVVLIASICGLVAVFGFVALFLLTLRKRNRKKKDEEAIFPVTNVKMFTYKELHTATRGFSEKLGHGGFGAVFRGELSDSSLVAVKRLERPGTGEKEFRAEVRTIGNVQHVNLVRLRGFCSENSHRLLVYDYMENGPLSVFLQRDGQNLSWDVRFRVAVGTAKGIAYLHEECRDCIIHCDIKPENILLDREFIAMVSDFGLAKLVGRDFSRILTTTRGTRGYVAPEWISGVAITAKADVYSYGMTLLEILGGRRNVEAPPPSPGREMAEGQWFFPPWAARQIIEGNVASVVDDRLAGAYDPIEAERMALVAVWCIQDDEVTRPAMGMVVKMLEGTVGVTVPPPPMLLQALISGDSFPGVGAVSAHVPSTGTGNSSPQH